MRKFVLIIIVISLIVVAIVIGISLYLVDDDMASCDRPSDSGSCQAADAIVAVSGGDTSSRARKAIELYMKGYSDKLIFSGDSADPTAISNAESMKRIAVHAGVPSSAIYLDEKSKNTRENAEQTDVLFKKLNVKTAILVSSPYHLRRVKMNFERVDSSVSYRTVAATDNQWRYWYLRPSGWLLALTEMGGLIELTMRGI